MRGAGSRWPFWTSSASRREFLQHRARSGAGRGPPPAADPPSRCRPRPVPVSRCRPHPVPASRPTPHRAQLSKLKPPLGACSTETAAILPLRRGRATPAECFRVSRRRARRGGACAGPASARPRAVKWRPPRGLPALLAKGRWGLGHPRGRCVWLWFCPGLCLHRPFVLGACWWCGDGQL